MSQTAVLDASKLKPFLECMDDYGVGDEADDPWKNNCLAADTVAYSNGLIARLNEAIDLKYEESDLGECQRLAIAAARVMGPRWPGIFSANTTVTAPYFVCRAVSLRSVNSENVRDLFSTALCPEALIVVEPLQASGEWWNEIQNCVAQIEEDEAEDPESDFDSEQRIFEPWRLLIKWFASELTHASMVRISVPRSKSLRGGCVFPRFAIGLTESGNVAGVSTFVVRG